MTTIDKTSGFEFRSKQEVNGWPIVHINLGTHPETGRPLVAKGVVAIGNIAFGVVSIGAAAFGVVSLAGFGLGIVSLGGFAIGIIALGAVALGYEFAFGAVVQSAKFAMGAISLNFFWLGFVDFHPSRYITSKKWSSRKKITEVVVRDKHHCAHCRKALQYISISLRR